MTDYDAQDDCWDDDDDDGSTYITDEFDERDQFVLVCRLGDRCCMPGYHFESECHTAEDVAAYFEEMERYETSQ